MKQQTLKWFYFNVVVILTVKSQTPLLRFDMKRHKHQ